MALNNVSRFFVLWLLRGFFEHVGSPFNHLGVFVGSASDVTDNIRTVLVTWSNLRSQPKGCINYNGYVYSKCMFPLQHINSN